MALFQLTINLDRLAVAIEKGLPALERIAAALDQAYPPIDLDRPLPPPAGPESHIVVTEEALRKRRQDRQRANSR